MFEKDAVVPARTIVEGIFFGISLWYKHSTHIAYMSDK